MPYPWNQKYLDYEIETIGVRFESPSDCSAWNQKYLDYEIETIPSHLTAWQVKTLEIKSISITRFKLSNQRKLCDRLDCLEIKSISITRLKPFPLRYLKHFIQHLKSKVSRLRDWNCVLCLDTKGGVTNLKSKVSRLRDWNCPKLAVESRFGKLEIKSISITRLKRR